jgi:hypothetical protein
VAVQRRWWGRASAATGVTTALLLGSGLAAGASPSVTTLYRQAVATTKGWSVHYASEGTLSKVPVLEVGDAGPASGTQQVLIGTGTTSDIASLIVIGDLTYVKGNANALHDMMLLSDAQATATAGKWILFSTTNSAFSQVVAGVRSHDVSEELALKGPLRLGASRSLDGYKVDTIYGRFADPGYKSLRAVLYVRASGRHDIVEEDTIGANDKPNGLEHTVYSLWGERVRPLAPTTSLSIGSVRGT